MNKSFSLLLIAVALAVAGGFYYWTNRVSTPSSVPGLQQSVAPMDAVPVAGMVTMVDLGADKCVPCKMMAPILQELEKQYRGRAAIVFLDVWKDKAPAERFGIRAIPTQIFFDEGGTEVHRHVGFMSKDEIVAQLKGMGVE